MEKEFVTLGSGEKVEVFEMALCEQDHILLRSNQLYRFVVMPDCLHCLELEKITQLPLFINEDDMAEDRRRLDTDMDKAISDLKMDEDHTDLDMDKNRELDWYDQNNS